MGTNTQVTAQGSIYRLYALAGDKEATALAAARDFHSALIVFHSFFYFFSRLSADSMTNKPHFEPAPSTAVPYRRLIEERATHAQTPHETSTRHVTIRDAILTVTRHQARQPAPLRATLPFYEAPTPPHPTPARYPC
eukprot:scaffold66562_cov47-Phaeocystis_antarctica.AAC.2